MPLRLAQAGCQGSRGRAGWRPAPCLPRRAHSRARTPGAGRPGAGCAAGPPRRSRSWSSASSHSSAISASNSCSPRAATTLRRMSSGVVGGRALLGQPGRHLGALGVAHQGHDVAVGGAGHQRLQPAELGLVGLDVGHPGPGEPDPQVRLELLHRAPAQVVRLVGGDDPVGPQPGHLADRLEQVVGAVAGQAEAQVHLPPGHLEPVRDVHQRLETRLVVGEVDDDRDRRPVARAAACRCSSGPG